MTSTNKILAMVRSRALDDDEQFYSIVLQIAASEARSGRKETAERLRQAVDDARTNKPRGASVPLSFAKPRGNLDGLLELREPRFRLADVVLSDSLLEKINDLVRQQLKREWLREHGKVPNRRVLFLGPPGSGKSMCAEALAAKLKLPLFVIRLDALITRFMGETAAQLRLVFNEVDRRRGVYLFDEFDALGGRRDAINDVAEMRRVLNSFLQFMESPNSTDSLVVAATNFPNLLDTALLRRFDTVLEFSPPTEEHIQKIVQANIRPLKHTRLGWKSIAAAAQGLSQSEIARAVEDAVKTSILDQRDKLSTDDIVRRLDERSEMRTAFSRNR